MADLEAISARIRAYQHKRVDSPREPTLEAAVALILHEPLGGHPELLFIERAEKQGDPWSGQMAFPGGRFDAADDDIAATAQRETLEETALELGPPIGQLDDVCGSRAGQGSVHVSPFVYTIVKRPQLQPNQEVRSTVWIPLHWILNPVSTIPYTFEHEKFQGTYKAFQYDRYVVWGLTYRILENLAQLLGRQLI